VELFLGRQRVADGQRRTHRAFWIILVGDRRSEKCHHCVANELLDRATVRLQFAPQERVVRGQNRADFFGIGVI
jgi:hypothetical protein